MAEGASTGDGSPGDPFAGSSKVAGEGEPDFYAALGLRPDASDDEIRRVYHRLAKLWHPDRYMAAPPALRARAERRMRALTAAHDMLGDPANRAAYDQRRGFVQAGPAVILAPPPEGANAPAEKDSSHLRSAPTPRREPANTTSAHAPASMRGDFNGAGHFMGMVTGIMALALLARTLRGDAYGSGLYVALGATVVLAGLALWFFTDDATPAKWATRVIVGEPQPAIHTRHARHAQHGAHVADPASASEGATDFELLVDEALAGVPAEFRPFLENVVVHVQPEPSAEDRASVGIKEGWTLFGLYHGVKLTDQPVGGAGPEEITIYQGPIERHCHGDAKRMRQQVRKTVLHELAHHFGIDHEQMPEWIR
jgi:predicted Zn-dependent protease with MMP-like domain